MNNSPQQSYLESHQAAKASPSTSDTAELEIECIDLVCKLEHDIAVAKEGYRDDQVKESATTSQRMLESLLVFAETHLQHDMEELEASVTAAAEKITAHRQVVKGQSWTRSLISVFYDSVDENSIATHSELGQAMAKVCATVFASTIKRLGAESNVAHQVQQSMELFVEEFTEKW